MKKVQQLLALIRKELLDFYAEQREVNRLVLERLNSTDAQPATQAKRNRTVKPSSKPEE